MLKIINRASNRDVLELFTPTGAQFSTNFSNCDLAVPGSPNISKLISPLLHNPSGNLLQNVKRLYYNVRKRTFI